ncbi:TlpA family protein disulfide reductase [Alteromonas gracilis]|uniref:TlpA family protein disulfide reductase n=1 Tax=Alteromonas gracilis TaxID=1479524 RepID=UPI0030D44A46
MPTLQRAQNRYDNIEFVFVNQSEAPSHAQRFLREQGIELDNVYYDFAGNSADKLGAYGLPATLFLMATAKCALAIWESFPRPDFAII